MRLPSVSLPREDLAERKLNNGHRAEKIQTVFRGDFAKVSSSQVGPLNIGQGIDVELELRKAFSGKLCPTLARGSHDRPPTRPLELESDKIYLPFPL